MIDRPFRYISADLFDIQIYHKSPTTKRWTGKIGSVVINSRKGNGFRTRREARIAVLKAIDFEMQARIKELWWNPETNKLYLYLS